MKNIVSLQFILLMLTTGTIYSQAIPNKFNYQVSIRDDNGDPIVDKEVSFRISILVNPNSPSNFSYREEHSKVLTANGIASLVIGNGNPRSGRFDTLTFHTKAYYLKVEFDEGNGSNYKDLSIAQLLTVPYAMAANQLDKNNAQTGQVLKWDGLKWSPRNDSIGSLTNSLNGDVTGLQNSNKVEKIQNRPVSASSPSAGQVLKWDGSQWRPDSDLTNGIISNLTGDVIGPPTNTKVEKLQGRAITSSAPSINNILKWNGSQWALGVDEVGNNSNQWQSISSAIYNSPITGSVLVGMSTLPNNNPKFAVRGNSSFMNANNFEFCSIFSQNNNGQFNINSPTSTYYSIMGYFENTSRPVIGIASTQSQTLSMGMFLDNNNRLTVTANIKSFIEDHPIDKDKCIVYASIEGPEAGAYERGTIKMINGKADIKFSDHFSLLINPSTMTVIVTPLSKNSKGLAVTSKTPEGLIIEELNEGNGTYDIDWEVKAVRKGYENFEVVRDKKCYKVNNPILND